MNSMKVDEPAPQAVDRQLKVVMSRQLGVAVGSLKLAIQCQLKVALGHRRNRVMDHQDNIRHHLGAMRSQQPIRKTTYWRP